MYEGGYQVISMALRFSSIEGAKTGFNALENSVMGYGQFVTIPKIGDQHFAVIGTPVYPGGGQPVAICFRKANVCIALSASGGLAPWVMDDVIGWTQIIESRIS